jgi:hypothetical protein
MRAPLLLIVFLTACGPPPAPPAAPLEPDDFVLGGIPAGADTAEVRLSFGDPDSVTAGDNLFDAGEPFATWHYTGFEVRFSGALPAGYLIMERGEETARGMRVGDPADELQRRYGEPDTRADDSWIYVEDTEERDPRILDFRVQLDTIRRIYIGRTL